MTNSVTQYPLAPKIGLADAMIDIVGESGMDPVLPRGLEGTLSERDQLLNRLPAEKILDIFENRESRVFVDKLGAMKSAEVGLPMPISSIILSFLFPVMLISAFVLPFLIDWYWSIAALFAAVTFFRSSRSVVVNSVRKRALSDPKLLKILMRHGVVWFELV